MKLRKKPLTEGIDHKSFGPMLDSFVSFASDQLGLKSLPNIKIQPPAENSFGGYHPGTNDLYITTKNRHPMDIFRTVAHEMVHHKQNEDGRIKDAQKEGATGSDIENEANAQAGKIMRWYAKNNGMNFGLSHVKEQVMDINDEFELLNEGKVKKKIVRKKLEQEDTIPPYGFSLGNQGIGPEVGVVRSPTGLGFGYSIPMSEEFLPEDKEIVAWAMSELTQKRFAEKYGDKAAEKLIETAFAMAEANDEMTMRSPIGGADKLDDVRNEDGPPRKKKLAKRLDEARRQKVSGDYSIRKINNDLYHVEDLGGNKVGHVTREGNSWRSHGSEDPSWDGTPNHPGYKSELHPGEFGLHHAGVTVGMQHLKSLGAQGEVSPKSSKLPMNYKMKKVNEGQYTVHDPSGARVGHVSYKRPKDPNDVPEAIPYTPSSPTSKNDIDHIRSRSRKAQVKSGRSYEDIITDLAGGWNAHGGPKGEEHLGVAEGPRVAGWKVATHHMKSLGMEQPKDEDIAKHQNKYTPEMHRQLLNKNKKLQEYKER